MTNGSSDRRKKAREQFTKEVDEALDRADASFSVDYAGALACLQGLAEQEVREICPEPTGIDTYNRVIAVVSEATRQNLAQAELVTRIRALGASAMRIAGRVPQLTRLLV